MQTETLSKEFCHWAWGSKFEPQQEFQSAKTKRGRREGDGNKKRSRQFMTFKHRQVTDLDVTDLGFSGPGFRSARQVLCGDASRLFLGHFSKHLSSVSGRTELCHEVRNPGPQRPQIIRNENHHLALFETFYDHFNRIINHRLQILVRQGIPFSYAKRTASSELWGPISCTLLRAAWQAHAECAPRIGQADLGDTPSSLPNSHGESQ